MFDTEGEALDAASRVLTPLNISTTVGARKGARHSLTHRTTESDIFGSGTDAGKQVPIPAEIISALQLTADRVVPEVLQIGDEAREFGGMDRVASLVRQAKTAAQAQGDPKIPTILTRKVDGISSFPSLQDAYTAALDRGLKPGEFALRGFTDNKGAFKGYQAINLKGLVRDQGTDTFATSTARAQTADEYVADQAREGKDVRQALRDQGLTVTQTGPVITATPEGAPVPTAPESESNNPLGITKIISGGQTGGDIGGVRAAQRLGIATGGTMPRGFRTQDGSHPEYAQEFGMVEDSSADYVPRTKKNVDDADATIAVLWGDSVGTRKTIGYARTGTWRYDKNETSLTGHKPVLVITTKDANEAAAQIIEFIRNTGAKTLNIAGHRESSQPGIEQFTTDALVIALTPERQFTEEQEAQMDASLREGGAPVVGAEDESVWADFEPAKPEVAKPEAAKATEEDWVPPWEDNSEAPKPATEAPAPSEQADTSTDDYTDDDYLAGQEAPFTDAPTELGKLAANPRDPTQVDPTPKQRQAFGNLLSHVVDQVKDPALLKLVKQYAIITGSSHRALWTTRTKTLSLSDHFLDRYIKDPVGRLAATLHGIFHELGHALDQADEHLWLSSTSPGWAIFPKQVSTQGAHFVFKDNWAGPFVSEMFALRNRALSANENDPLRAVHDLGRYGFHELADLVANPTNYPVRMRVIREVFAQAHGIYMVSPKLLQQEAPQTYRFFEDLYAHEISPDSPRRTLTARVRDAFRPNLPQSRSERGGPRSETGRRPQERSTGPSPGADSGRASVESDLERDLTDIFSSKRKGEKPGTTPQQFEAELQKTIGKRLTRELLSRPNITVLHKVSEAPFPVAQDTAGLYLPDGRVFFFTENILPGEAFGKLVHEQGAHYGLRRMVGDEVYNGVLRELQRMVAAPEGYQSVKAAYARALQATGKDSPNLWHETLAYLAESSPRHGLIRRIVTAIKQFLLKLGIPVGRLSDQDIIGLVQLAAFREGQNAGLSEGQMASEDTAYREAQKQIEAIKPIRNADGKLLAPNGKVSKLNERQWKVVRTSMFKDWFGDWENDPGSASQLVDENGEPKVFWHGTQADFDTFSSDPKRGGLLYFAPTSEMAEAYAVGSEYVRRETTEGGSIYPVFLNARNIAGTQTKPAGYFRDVERLGSVGFMMKGKDSAWVSEGVQGVFIAVIDPIQVKSAVGNRGTFSPFDDSILRSTRTEPSAKRTVAEYAYSKASDGTIEKRWGVTDGVSWHATGFKTEREAQKALDAMPKFERTTEKAVTLTEEQKQTLRTERDRLLAENAARNAKTVRPDTIENLRNPPPVEGATPQRKAPTAKPLRSDEKRLSVTELSAYRNMAPVLKQQFEATRDRIVALQKRPMTGAEEQELREQLLVDAAAEVFDKDVDALWAFVEVTKLMDKGLPAQRVVNALDELYTPAQPGEPIKPSREHLEGVRGLFGLGGETLSTLEQWRRAVDLWHQYARRETNMIDEFFPAKSDDKATAADDRQTAWDVVKRLTGQKQDSGDTAGMQIEQPFETSIPLFRGQHFTQDLATYLNARLANNAIGVPESEFLAGLNAAEDKLNPDQAPELRQAFGQLIDLRDAAAASPEKRAKLAIGSMMAWLGIAEEDPVPANLTGKQRQLWEDRLKDAGYLHGLTPVGQAIQQFLLEQGTPHPKSNAARFARAMAELPDSLLKRYGGKDLQALYDLHGQEMPLSNLVITFDARNNEYRITQELITGNPYEGMMAYDYRTGEIISVKRFIDQYLTGKTDAWQGQKWAAAAELTQDEARKQKLLTEWNLARTPTGQKRIEEWKARGLTFKNKFIGVTKKSLRALQDAAAFSLGQWSRAELWSPSVLLRDLKKYGGEGAWVRYHLAPEPAGGTTVEPKTKGLMSFAYRERDPGAQYGNTFDAVKAGARTSTTQFASWPQYENYLALKPGDVVRFYRDASRKEHVNVVVDEVQKVTEADAKRSLTRGEAEQSPLFADDAETLHVDAREITKLGRALGRVLGKRFSSDLDAFNEGLIGLRLEADWTLTTPLSELVDKDISGNKDFVHPYHEALIESRQKRQQGWEPGAEGRYNYTQADLEQAEAAYQSAFDGSKASHPKGLAAIRDAFADDTRLRDEFVRLFSKLWRNVNKHYEGLELYKGGDLKPINIFSNSEDPLGAALTNPTHYNPKGGTSSSRGKLTGPYRELDKGIDYGGKHYADVEQAYHALKGETDLPKSVLMVELITAKLQQYPFLVKEIAKRGGVGFLEASTHDYYGAKGYWTTAGSNGFIKALVKAYKKVTGAETLGGKADLRRDMRKAIKDHHDTYVDYQENERPVEEYRQQYGTDIGNAPPAVRDTAMAREQDAEDRLFQEINTRRDVLGEHSTKVTGVAQNQPIPQGGVTASPATQRTNAFKLVKALVDSLPLQGLNIQVYNDKDIATLKERLYQRNPLFGVEFETRLEEDRLPAMVTFADNEVMIYYDSKRTDAEVIDAIGHEMGHVVLRALLDSERIRNTPLWNRILNDYRMSGSEQRFMEWFADEVKNWVTSRRKAGVTDAKTRLFKRVVDAVKRILEIIGFRPTPGAVSAYLDGLVLREKTLEQEAFLKGLQGQFYDRMTFLQTVNSTTTPILDIPMHMDFLTLDGVKKGTLDQVQALEERFPKLKTLHRAVGDALTLVGDTFRTLNGWLRAQGSQEMTLLADMLDNLARGADQIKLYSNEELGQALTDLLAQQDTTEQRVAEAQGRPPRAQYDEAGRARLRRKLLEQANALRARDGVRGVSMVGYIDPDTGMAKITPVPIYHESFTEAVRREFQGEWGSGYRHLVFGKSEEDLKRWGQELLRNDPQSEEAKAIKAWLDKFYNDYLVPRYTGPLSTARKESVVHIGRLENWGLARMYNSDAVAANSNDFVELLMEYVPDMTLTEAWKMTHAIITGRELLGDKETSEATGDPHTYSPGAKSKKERWLNIPIDKLLPFLEQRVDKVLDSYVHSFIKRAEWDRRFGEEVEQSTKEGGKYFWKQNYYTDIIKQGAVLNAKELDAPRRAFLKRRTADVIEAYLGRYKVFDTNPHARAVMSATQAAVNWLTMPLSALSQFPDLVGPLTRMGGNTKALMAGYRDALAAIRNKGGDLWKAAELMGVVFRDTKNAGAAAIFDQQFMTEGAQRWNDRLFKYNGMQLFSNFSRVAAYATSKYWLESLATDPAGERQLGQVGLTQKDVEEWIKGGYKEYTTGDSQNSVPFRIALARMRFVNESVFSPHSGQRPLWANHPYMMLIWHLKSFTYSFFTQILAPAFREVKNNPAMYSKMMAVLPMGLMMPLALMGMALRDEIKNDMLPWRSGLSDADRKDNFWEKTSRVISSTGILGPAQLLLDADRSASWGRSPIFALMGPTATKTEEFFRADGVLDGLMRLTPGLSMLPQERRQILNWWRNE